VQAAALPRAAQLLTWLTSRDDDLIILTETSNGPGTRDLLDWYRGAGAHVLHSRTGDGDRGCAIVSRLPLHPRPDVTQAVTLPGRAVAATIDTDPAVTVVGLYAPSSDRAPDKVARKQRYLSSVLDALRRHPDAERSHLVLGGDYNVIPRDHQPRHRAFLPFEYAFLDTLRDEFGLLDAYRHLHPGVPAHSWFGRGGNPYRFDYFHLGAGLAGTLTGCAYLHEPRERAYSDHAAVTLTLDIPTRPATTLEPGHQRAETLS
jgi:exodeoxyribonuclease-3